MNDLTGARIAVAGAGVFGLTAALAVVWRGATVELYDPRLRAGRLGFNASGVAAGMLAPAFEAVLDPASAGRFGLLREGRDRWPALLERIGLTGALDRSGALMVADQDRIAHVERAAAALTAAGAVLETLSAEDAHRLQPALGSSPAAAVFSPEDWRIDPRTAVPALLAAFEGAGGRLRARRLMAVEGYDAVVLATGADGEGLVRLAPELTHLSPIKGQLLHLDGPPTGGPTLRFPDGYIAPQPSGAVVGATMEAGRRSRRTTPAVLDALRTRAALWVPGLATAGGRGFAGVRASTPDGLPLAGPGAHPGVLLATGARRNGWLLAPLVAEVVAEALAGRSHSQGALFAPGRFGA